MKQSINKIIGIFSDFFHIFIPVRGRNSKYEYAFIVHPRYSNEIKKFIPFFNHLPVCLQDLFQKWFFPVTLSRITGLTDIHTKKPINGYVISIPMATNVMLNNRKLALKKIRAAIKLARNKGAKIVGLGALTSSLSNGGLQLLDINDIGITTGHAYTGYSVTQTLLKALQQIDASRMYSMPIAIVGAAGSVGSLSAEILAEYGFNNFYLIDIDRKLEKVEKLKQKLVTKNPNLSITMTTDMSVLKGVIGIVAATNSPDALIKKEYLTPGTIIVDDAQPSDVSPEVYSLKSVLVLEAGAVYTPGICSHINMGLSKKDDNFCCLAEVLILASNRHTENFIINRATFDEVSQIVAMGEHLNFTIANSQNEKGDVSEAYMNNVFVLAKKRITTQ